ncbi:Tm-1-like ATP-binding domain-containing protein [Mesorhizobium sp. IMUNJ 23232]|uniref:Tm-1-like ATP-binding domain-containing protein n=1 Tax=Mesorhizobium sp. IMUNJ 23232 TaxID=3376064 RepID=UPI0037903B2D
MTEAKSSDGAVAIVATLDTKQAEASFVAEIIRSRGREVVFVDVGTSKDGAARSNDPASLLAEIGRNARASVNALHVDGTITAIVGIAGGKGSGVFGEAVADLPYGFPKLLVSSARPALLADLAARSDILLYPTIVDLFGINGFTSRILRNAADAIAAMHYAPQQPGSRRKIVAMTAFGVTTPAVNHCVRLLSQYGIETIVFPANGAGGRKMESLVDAGEFDAVLDLTTTELADEHLGGTATAGAERLTAAGRKGIPQLIAPGAVDMVNFGIRSSVPARFCDRKLYAHTPYTTLMRTSEDETFEIGRITAQKLAGAKGPSLVIWPSEGVSDYDREGGVFHDPGANRAWLAGLRSALPASVQCQELRCHINDPAFAEAAVGWIVDQIHNRGVRDAHV